MDDHSLQSIFTPKFCYICHKPISGEQRKNKWFCPGCESYNSQKRDELCESLNLQKKDGLWAPSSDRRYALVTGGRIKIGYETCLKLLRSGAFVILTTRFPVDAAYRYAKEDDFEDWCTRLKIYKIDFRNIIQVEEFATFVDRNLSHLDILINNAAQTVRRPKEYYEHLRELESREIRELPPQIKALIYDKNLSHDFFKYQGGLDQLQITQTVNMKMFIADTSQNHFPVGKTDTNGDPIDMRIHNSWISKAEEVSTIELLEVQFVNVTAPYILCARLKEAMKRSPYEHRFIINVSAMEGKFNRKNKNCFHPHTNMAKAALNMLTRTAAQDYARDRIYMNSVDTGWITDENPYHLQERNKRRGIVPPLSSKDGAARVLDPIFYTLLPKEDKKDRTPLYGKFFKNYKKTNW